MLGLHVLPVLLRDPCHPKEASIPMKKQANSKGSGTSAFQGELVERQPPRATPGAVVLPATFTRGVTQKRSTKKKHVHQSRITQIPKESGLRAHRSGVGGAESAPTHPNRILAARLSLQHYHHAAWRGWWLALENYLEVLVFLHDNTLVINMKAERPKAS